MNGNFVELKNKQICQFEKYPIKNLLTTYFFQLRANFQTYQVTVVIYKMSSDKLKIKLKTLTNKTNIRHTETLTIVLRIILNTLPGKKGICLNL